MSPEIILASASPVRKEVLDGVGLAFSVYPSEFEESIELPNGESFENFAKRLALGKARDVASKISNAIIIGADSFAVLDGNILGKPGSKQRAIEYLKRLSGVVHEFYTGMAVIDTVSGREVVDCVKARVHFRTLDEEEISSYVEKEEVTTAAGGYRIQGLGAVLVKKTVGDYYAVVGLSPSKLQEMLKKLNYNLLDYVPLR